MSDLQVSALARLISREVSSYEKRMNAARQIAVRMGYNKSFDPVDGALDADMDVIGEQDVRKLVDKMKAHCACD